jgi:hypothetical protein
MLAVVPEIAAAMNNWLRHYIRVSSAVCGMFLFAVGMPSRAEWLFNVDAGASYDSNLTGAENVADIRRDWSATFDASVGQFFALTGNDGLTLTTNVRGGMYDRYKELNTAGIGASASYRHKFGLGRDVPWAALLVNGWYDDYRSDIRDGARFDLHTEVGQRFTENIDAVAGVAYDRRYASNGQAVVPGLSSDVFDLIGHSAYFRFGYVINEWWLLGINGTIRRGEVESTSQQGLAVFLASSAIAADSAFNDRNLFAYRLRGTTSTLGATLSRSLSNRSSLNLSYTYELTNSSQHLEYRSYNAALAFAYRF